MNFMYLDSNTYFIGRWAGIVVFFLLLVDFCIMELFRLRGGIMKQWLASRIYTNKIHGIFSVTILLGAILHAILLVFGHWSNQVSSFPFWMTEGEELRLMFNLGAIAACIMILLSIHGYYHKWFWKKWSHQAWKRTHFWLSILLILIVLVHAVTNGKEMEFIGFSIRG